jgi:hypothetical protein
VTWSTGDDLNVRYRTVLGEESSQILKKVEEIFSKVSTKHVK